MFTGWHKGDYLKVPNEDRVMDTLRPLAIPPGDYMMPRPESTEQMRSPAFVEKFKRGPVMMFTVMPGASMAMGKQDRKSTRLNSSHLVISYAVFCLKKKKK